MLSSADAGESEAEELSSEDGVWTGQDLGYKTGDRVRLLINDRAGEYTVRGVLGARSGEAIVVDLSQAVRLLEA
jgi:hypothetical protein